MAAVGTEMFFSDAADGESPDLELWAEILDDEDIEELRLMREREQ